MTLLAIACLLCAVLPAAIFCVNLRAYKPPPPFDARHLDAAAEKSDGTVRFIPSVSILIPARNEEAGIAAAVHAALASAGVDVEVVVMDDSSTDRTAEIVRQIAATNRAVRLEQAPDLPAGWNGKQHACWALANSARHDLLCFVDADVRLAPDAALRMAAFLTGTGSQLVSGFPRQITVTWLEQLLLPLIHFILLGYLPVPQMRSNPSSAYAAGCGQFLLADRAAYFASGGHAAIRATMHDGIKLPRLLRTHGFRTDIADLTPLAEVRMYTTAPQVWNGLAKNAVEGMAAPATIVPASILLVLGQIAPFLLLRLAVLHRLGVAATVATIAAVIAAWLPRLLAVVRFRQPILSAVLHPLGILTLVVLQWYALLRTFTGARVTWKSRAYTAG
ncbi:MAG: glycosyltransferase [Acidobacteriaceae bacterium]